MSTKNFRTLTLFYTVLRGGHHQSLESETTECHAFLTFPDAPFQSEFLIFLQHQAKADK